ncbi:MAG: hypothetical protein HN742_20580 [Lentisphaerae bacterium]|nr:hypothetical protein [Lentisphaerota bacterium]MBT4817309.1 hypothetical protein [Lentisphaerota bacterium]MBT5604943.1 hypothetical protein [Lentisphaerota bacterium]MBT7844288.1 hypothetical protein [Lentisphaerota bacterium]
MRRSGPQMYLCLSGVLAVVLVSGCVTGQRAYQHGDYAKAVRQATKRLRSDPDNLKALDVLKRAFPAAQSMLLETIDHAVRSSAPFRWERSVTAYAQLNGLAYAIRTTPAAHGLFPSPRIYQDELEQAKFHAAEARYAAGRELLARGNREDALGALKHFSVADQLVPDFRDIAAQMAIAQDLATVKVVVQPVTCDNRDLDVRFLENRLHAFLASCSTSQYIRFYTVEEAARVSLARPDHRIELHICDFGTEETQITETRETLRKEDVLIGRTKSRPPQDVFGTVRAYVVTWEKSIATHGLLDLRIVEVGTTRPLLHEKFPGESVWRDSWATFRGDERALPEPMARMVRKRECAEPTRQFLFEAVTEGLFNTATERIRTFYAGR